MLHRDRASYCSPLPSHLPAVRLLVSTFAAAGAERALLSLSRPPIARGLTTLLDVGKISIRLFESHAAADTPLSASPTPAR